MDKKKLGEALLKANKISKEDLKYAFAMHDKIGGDFAPLLVKLGYVSDDDITGIIGNMEGIRTIDVSSLVIPQKLVYSLPRDVIEKHNVMPVARKEGFLTLAMSDVNDFEAIEKIQFLTGLRVEPVLASREAIRKTIVQFYSREEEKQEQLGKRRKPLEAVFELVETGQVDALELLKATISLLAEKNIISPDDLMEKLSKAAK